MHSPRVLLYMPNPALQTRSSTCHTGRGQAAGGLGGRHEQQAGHQHAQSLVHGGPKGEILKERIYGHSQSKLREAAAPPQPRQAHAVHVGRAVHRAAVDRANRNGSCDGSVGSSLVYLAGPRRTRQPLLLRQSPCPRSRAQP